MSGNELDIDEQVSAADRSAASASKHRTFGAFPKTLAQLCKAVKAGRPHQEKLIEVTLDALNWLDNETLLKVGPDLANFCSLAKEKHADCSKRLQILLSKVGRLDNDLVVFTLRNKADLLPQNA